MRRKSAILIPLLFAACTGSQAASDNPDPQLVLALQNAAVAAGAELEDSPIAGMTAADFKVGDALEEHIMGADDVAQNKDRARPIPTGRRAYVLSGPNGYRAVVFVRKRAGTWTVSQVHGKFLGNAIDATLRGVRASHKADNDDYFLVDIAGMHLLMLAHREGGALMLTTIHDRPDLSLKAGSVQPAAQLLPRLASEARRWNTEMAKTFGRRS
jgi:hypothetical protein